tara:strand:- start:2263 stop:2427 length:165 start_codon:yes stop_codon:yes gene_type:complete
MNKEDKIMAELETLLRNSIKTESKPKQFRHKVTGEIVNQISLLEINQYIECEDL